MLPPSPCLPRPFACLRGGQPEDNRGRSSNVGAFDPRPGIGGGWPPYIEEESSLPSHHLARMMEPHGQYQTPSIRFTLQHGPPNPLLMRVSRIMSIGADGLCLSSLLHAKSPLLLLSRSRRREAGGGKQQMYVDERWPGSEGKH